MKSKEKRSRKRSQKRREEKSEEKRGLKPEMSDDHSGGEGSVGHEADFVDTTEDMEVELCLPREVNMEQFDLVRTSETPREPSPRVRLLAARRSGINSSPRTGPDPNGPDTACPF